MLIRVKNGFINLEDVRRMEITDNEKFSAYFLETIDRYGKEEIICIGRGEIRCPDYSHNLIDAITNELEEAIKSKSACINLNDIFQNAEYSIGKAYGLRK